MNYKKNYKMVLKNGYFIFKVDFGISFDIFMF